VRITIFPDRSITRKPLETRMGSGKGSPDHWVAPVKPGTCDVRAVGCPEELAREAMRKASHKLPVKTKFVMREEAGE
jgi:large subunit ribosomal protein L16